MSELVDFILKHVDGFTRARLPSLYSDFRLQRESNPDGFVANCTTWLNALTKASEAGLIPSEGPVSDTLTVDTGEALLQALQTKEWGRPLAIGAVIDDGLKRRKLIPYDAFLKSNRSIYGRQWTVQPRWLISWILSRMNIFEAQSAHGSLPTGRFVAVENVEKAGNLIIARLGSRASRLDRIYAMATFKERAANVLELKSEISISDTAALLKYLARDIGAITYNQSAVVFKTEGDQSSDLSSQDMTIASLKASITELQKQVDLASNSIATLSEKAINAVTQKNRTLALAALRSKKLKEKTLAQRTETLSQFEEVLASIEQATDQITLVKMMKDSAAVLQDLHKEVSGVDHVHDVVEQLKEETMKVDEVSRVIQDAGQEASALDESEVDEELEALLKEANTKEDSLKELDGLQVPQELPKPPEPSPKEHIELLATSSGGGGPCITPDNDIPPQRSLTEPATRG